MRKKDVVQIVSLMQGKPEYEIKPIIDSFLKELKLCVKLGHKVTIQDFATFKKITRKAHKGQNFQTKERIDIPERMEVKIIPSKRFIINGF